MGNNNLQDYWNQIRQQQALSDMRWREELMQMERNIAESVEPKRAHAPQKPESKLLLLEDL